jgi:polar amino acid transport system substrate-binding protein
MRRELFLTIFMISVFTVFSSVLVCYVNMDRSLSRITKHGIINIGYAIEAPYAFVDSEGNITGIDPEIAKIIAQGIGATDIRWHLCEFGSLISGLEAERFDVITGGLFITPEKKKYVKFSLPTMRVTQGLLVRKGNPLNIHSYQDFIERDTIKVAVLNGSIEEEQFIRMNIPSERIIRVPDVLSGRTSVESGIAQGLARSNLSLQWIEKTKQLGNTSIATPFIPVKSPSESISYDNGFAFRKKDRKLIAEWNRHLSEFLSSNKYPSELTRFDLDENSLNAGIKQ